MTWASITSKLKSIEDNLTRRGSYIDEYDAMLLAAVQVENKVDDASISQLFSPTTNLKGLTLLVSDLLNVLGEAYVEQQGSLIVLKQAIDKCMQDLHTRDSDGYGPDNNFNDESDISKRIDDTDTIMKSSQSAECPPGFSSLSSSSNSGHVKSDSRTAQIHLRKSLQEINNGLIVILDTKLIAHEIIMSTTEIYQRHIVHIATENGVLDPIPRLKFIMRPQLSKLLGHNFLDTNEAHSALTSLKNVFARKFYHDNLPLAERKLLLNQNFMSRSKSLGLTKLKMGAGLTLLLWSFSECFNNEQAGQEIWRDPTFAIFMCLGDLLLLFWMWGVSMRVWRKAGIDFVQLLVLDGTEVEDHRSPESLVYSSATDLSLIFFGVFIVFNKATRGVLNIQGSRAFAHILPLLMVIYFYYRACYPMHSRRKWIQMLQQVLTAPWSPVGFRDGYIGDLLTSLVRVIIPMCFSFAYLLMSAYAWLSNDIKAASSTSDLWWVDSVFYKSLLVPFITLYPLWIRLMQCLRRCVESGERWPHLANACKYATAIAVISYGTFQPHLRSNPLWILCFILATIFQYIWDLTMDWGMLVKCNAVEASEHSFLGVSLRSHRLLGPSWYYITVMIANFILRFAWALTLLPDSRNEDPKTFYTIMLFHLTPLVAALEVVRRMVWGFFRLEHEQLQTLGCPDIFSLLTAEGSAHHNTFDKMEYGSSRGLGSVSDTVKPPHNSRNTASNEKQEVDWDNVGSSLPLFLYAPLGPNASMKARARFIESVLFAFLLCCIVVSAAISDILH